ncbi:leucine-rich repeat transmembrane protein CCDC168 isoform X2 [Notamacropus eugenii]|uniref:leucine-rich repeat transmembrane protein CCDC168 isoform X2 n=1 Tax=Notamacropus eugenii TaxID=9315 RepID=UPI003B66F2F5
MEEDSAAILWDYLESWGAVYDWKAVFITTFLVIALELLLLEICRTCQKKISKRKVQKESSSDSLKEEENTFLKNLGYEHWPHTQLPPKRKSSQLRDKKKSGHPHHPHHQDFTDEKTEVEKQFVTNPSSSANKGNVREHLNLGLF